MVKFEYAMMQIDRFLVVDQSLVDQSANHTTSRRDIVRRATLNGRRRFGRRSKKNTKDCPNHYPATVPDDCDQDPGDRQRNEEIHDSQAGLGRLEHIPLS